MIKTIIVQQAIEADIQDIVESTHSLDEAKPASQAAKDAVERITKSSLDEIRVLPKQYNLSLRSVGACPITISIKESELDSWENVKKLHETTFINNLLGFEAGIKH